MDPELRNVITTKVRMTSGLLEAAWPLLPPGFLPRFLSFPGRPVFTRDKNGISTGYVHPDDAEILQAALKAVDKDGILLS